MHINQPCDKSICMIYRRQQCAARLRHVQELEYNKFHFIHINIFLGGGWLAGVFCAFQPRALAAIGEFTHTAAAAWVVQHPPRWMAPFLSLSFAIAVCADAVFLFAGWPTAASSLSLSARSAA
jgi:hypothetical protein